MESETAASRVAIALFNTLAHNSRFWGNMGLSLFAGRLADEGIQYDLYALLMRPGEEEVNRRTVEEFVRKCAANRYSHIIMHSSWLPWLPDMLREETGARILSLDDADRLDMPHGLSMLGPQDAALAAIRGASTLDQAKKVLTRKSESEAFHPKFNFTFLGSHEPVTQEIAFVSMHSCPYRRDIRKNPLFKGLKLDRSMSTSGCSYCAGARVYEPLPEEQKREKLAYQIRYLQGELPTLTEIAVPFPEDYLDALRRIILDARKLDIRPITFSGQFRAGALVASQDELDRLIETALREDFRFKLGVVGLESFNDRDLQIFNRDSAAEVREAVAVLARLRKKFLPDLFMPDTVGSFILFHPWQTLEGLRSNVAAMERHKIEGLFSTININDLRIHQGVALYSLADREGLTQPRSERRVHEVPLGGYFEERPWRFRHADAQQAHELFSVMTPRTPERIGLLKCITATLEDSGRRRLDPEKVMRDMDGLARVIQSESRWHGNEAGPLLLGEQCNQGCTLCLFNNAGYAVDLDRALAAFESMDLSGRNSITLAGREPATLRWLPRLIRHIRKSSGLTVRLMTNGRVMLYPRVAEALAASGAGGFLVKLHAGRPDQHDRICRVRGAFRQTMEGAARLRSLRESLGLPLSLGFVIIAGDHNREGRSAMAYLAAGEGADEIRFALPMGGLNLRRIDALTDRVAEAVQRAADRGVSTRTDPSFSLKWILQD
jgi:hypothetical protein